MREIIKAVVLAAAAVLTVGGAAVAGERQLIPFADVPAVVRKAADKAAPGTIWLPLATTDGTGYLLIGSDPSNRTVEFVSDATGKVAGVRVDIPLTAVPSQVRAALRKELPNFQPKRVQAGGTSTAKVNCYRYQGPGYEGLVSGVYVSADGKTVTKVPGNR